MPRIPQGEFDQNPSTRVGVNQAPTLPSGLDHLTKGLSAIAGAAAELQDQSERTDAYSYANKVKQDYLQKKINYVSALDSADGNGMADYIDPTDTNPDISKRKRIQRPVQEMYMDMVKSYEDQKKQASSLQRGDIAHDLMRQYVGDDLMQLQMQTNKHINRVREKEVQTNLNDNLELHLSTFAELATDPTASPEQISLGLSHMHNKLQREIGTVSNILGTAQTKDVHKLLDRAYSQYANQIISTGVTGSTVMAAEGMINKIKDPSQKTLASIRLQNIRKATGEVKTITTLNTAKDMTQTLVNTPVLNNQDYAKVVIAAKNTLNAYIDPKYSTVTDQDKNSAAAELFSTALAKRTLQENAETSLAFLNAPSLDVDEAIPVGLRAPSGDSASVHGPKTKALLDNIEKEMEASGISGMINNPELTKSVRDMTLQKMKALHGTMKDDVADIVSGKYPALAGREKYEKIHQVANAQLFGDPSLVGKKERTEFQSMYKSEMAKDPMAALGLLNQKLSQAGDAYEGEGSYKRAMAIDLADKDQSLAYLIPMADADPVTQYKMVQDASQYKRMIDETDVNQSHMQENFEVHKNKVPALAQLMRTNPSMYDGIKQAIFNSASTRIKSKSDVDSAMQAAISEMSGLYSSKSVGGSSFFAVNRPAKNFNKENPTVIERGITKATALPQLTPADKLAILEKYNPKVLPRRKDGSVVAPPSDKVDWYLQRLVTIEPDGRYPNMHNVKINGASLSIKGKLLKISADDILKYGQETSQDIKNSYMPNAAPRK